MTNSKAGKASLWQCGRQQLRVGRSVLTPPFPPRDAGPGANRAPAGPEGQQTSAGEQTGPREARAVLAGAPERGQEAGSGIVSWDSRPRSPR